MTPIRIFQPRNRLAELVNRDGGIPIATALQRATSNVESVREDCVQAIDAAVDALHHALPDADETPGQDQLTLLYDFSNEIVSIAATLDLRDVSRAAYSLCELLDRYRGHAAWSRRAVMVHIEALRLLRAPSEDAAGRAAIIAGLDQVLYMTARER